MKKHKEVVIERLKYHYSCCNILTLKEIFGTAEDLVDIVKDCIFYLSRENMLEEDPFLFRISSDGTYINKKKIQHFTVSPLWVNNVQSRYNCFSVALVETTEKHKTLKMAIEQIKMNEKISFLMQNLNCEFYFVSDWNSMVRLLFIN